MAEGCLPQQRKATVTMRTLHLALSFLSIALLLVLTTSTRAHAQGPSEYPVALEQQFRELVKAGKFDEAQPLTGKLIDAVKLRFGSESKEYASALLNIPALALKFPSEADLLTALRIYENHFGLDDPAIAPILSLLAQTYMLNSRRQGNASKLAEAKPMLDRALAILEKKPGADTAQYADALVVLGEFYRASKQPSEAEAQFQRAFSVFERSPSANRRQAISALYQLEQLYRESNRHADAMGVWRRIAAIQEAALGPDHDETLSAIENVARALRGQCRDEEAADLERRTFPKTAPKKAENMERHAETVRAKWGVGHTGALDMLTKAGDLYLKLQRHSDARRTYERVIAGIEKVHAEYYVKHPIAKSKSPIGKSLQYAKAQAGIAEIERLEGRFDRAEQGYRDAVGAFDEHKRPFPVEWLDGLEVIYKAQHREADAAAIRERAEKRRAELKSMRRCQN